MKNSKKYFEGFLSGASRISRVWGRHSPTRFTKGAKPQICGFWHRGRILLYKAADFLCRGFCRFPFHSQHHMKKRFCQLKGAFGENGCEKVLCFPLLPSTDRAAVFPNTFFFFITTTVGKPGLGKMDAKKVAGFQKISAAHGSSLFSFCFHSKGGATAF